MSELTPLEEKILLISIEDFTPPIEPLKLGIIRYLRHSREDTIFVRPDIESMQGQPRDSREMYAYSDFARRIVGELIVVGQQIQNRYIDPDKVVSADTFHSSHPTFFMGWQVPHLISLLETPTRHMKSVLEQQLDSRYELTLLIEQEATRDQIQSFKMGVSYQQVDGEPGFDYTWKVVAKRRSGEGPITVEEIT